MLSEGHLSHTQFLFEKNHRLMRTAAKGSNNEASRLRGLIKPYKAVDGICWWKSEALPKTQKPASSQPSASAAHFRICSR